MSPKKELKVGLTLWGVGLAAIYALVYTNPRFFIEGMMAAGMITVVGFLLIWCGVLDLYVDDFYDDLKKEQKNNEKS